MISIDIVICSKYKKTEYALYYKIYLSKIIDRTLIFYNHHRSTIDKRPFFKDKLI